MRSVIGACALLVLSACGASRADPDEPVSSPAVHEGPASPGAHPLVEHDEMWSGLDSPDPAWSTCAADAECVAVEVGCCDHCNGGRLVSVRAEHAEAARVRAIAPCREVACTERGCDGAAPRCVSGRCAFVALYRTSP